MKVFVNKINGDYYLNVEGQEPQKCEVKQPKGWDATVFLPENPTNRKLINKARLDANLEKSPEYELTVKTPVTITRGPKTPKKPDIEYLDEKDRAVYQKLLEKIKAAKEKEKEEAKKPKSPKEILMAKIAKYQAQLEALDKE